MPTSPALSLHKMERRGRGTLSSENEKDFCIFVVGSSIYRFGTCFQTYLTIPNS
jgi:hypothetical protein